MWTALRFQGRNSERAAPVGMRSCVRSVDAAQDRWPRWNPRTKPKQTRGGSLPRPRAKRESSHKPITPCTRPLARWLSKRSGWYGPSMGRPCSAGDRVVAPGRPATAGRGPARPQTPSCRSTGHGGWGRDKRCTTAARRPSWSSPEPRSAGGTRQESGIAPPLFDQRPQALGRQAVGHADFRLAPGGLVGGPPGIREQERIGPA